MEELVYGVAAHAADAAANAAHAAYNAHAAAHAAYNAHAADATAEDEFMSSAAEDVVQVLIKLKAPGAEFLYLTE